MSIADNIKKARKNKGYTQEQLAEILEVGQNTLARYENETRTPTSEMLSKLALALNVTTDCLLGIEQEIEIDEETKQIMALREQYRRSPNTRVLFDLAKNATEKDIKTVAKLLEILNNENNAKWIALKMFQAFNHTYISFLFVTKYNLCYT